MNIWYDCKTGKEIESGTTIDSACLSPMKLSIILVSFRIPKWMPKKLYGWILNQIWWLFVPESRWAIFDFYKHTTGNTTDCEQK